LQKISMAKSIAEKDKAAHLHSYSNLSHSGKTEPLVIVGGDDIHVIDQYGRRYVEGMSDFGALHWGSAIRA